MKRGVAALVTCVAMGISAACGQSTQPAPQASGASDGGSDATLPPEATLDVSELSDDELVDHTARLRRIVIPPVGTALSIVDRVYGKPRVEEELRPGQKGVAAWYPMHIYDLLPPRPRAEFRAFLYVTNHDGVVARAGINHYCVIKNRKAGGPQSAELARALRRESEGVLLDLLAIREKHRTQLDDAAWEQ